MRRIITILALLVGCHHPKVVNNGIETYEKPWNRAKAEVLIKTATLTNCPTNNLSLKLLQIDRGYPVSLLVYGCGYEVYYDYNMRNPRAGWVLTATKGFAPSVVVPVTPSAPVIQQNVNITVQQQQQ